MTSGASIGCMVKRYNSGPVVLKMAIAVDKHHLTLQHPEALYLNIAISRSHMLGLYDSGSNISIISNKLARELGEPVTPYNSTFH